MYLPGWVLQYLLYLSSMIWSCKSLWLLTPVLPKGPGKPGKAQENFAFDLLCSKCTCCCFWIKDSPEPAQWEPPSLIRAYVDLEIRTVHCFVFFFFYYAHLLA